MRKDLQKKSNKNLWLFFIILTLTILITLIYQQNSKKENLSCEKLMEKIEKLKEKINYCTSYLDCRSSLEFSGCYLGCLTFHNKNENLEELKELTDKYKSSCSQGCFKDCPGSLLEKEIECLNNKCVVAS